MGHTYALHGSETYHEGVYSFAKRPLWILSHILIFILICVLVGLGFWQRDRYIEEQGKADDIAERANAPAQEFRRVMSPEWEHPNDVPESIRYTRVEAIGTFDVANEVAILNRSQNGAPGAWVLTPLVLDDGSAIPVIRGWIPFDPIATNPPFELALPPDGEVHITGAVQLTQERGSFGQIDPDEGQLASLARVDLDRFAQQLPYDLHPAWVQLDGQTPPQESIHPILVELSITDPSQNFSYMVQWWIFALVAVIGYPLVLRMVGRQQQRSQVPIDDVDDQLETVASSASGNQSS